MNGKLASSHEQQVRRRRFSFLAFVLLGAALLFAIPCAAAPCDYTVTSLADSGAGSLRAAFPALAASGLSNICFSVTGTITLASPLQVTIPVTITGGTNVIVSGNNQVQIFVVNLSSPTTAMRINGLTLTNGLAALGGAMQVVQGNATLVGTAITNNSAQSGGGVYNQGTLTLSGCSVSTNTATSGNGGGIFNAAGSTLLLQSCAVANNTANPVTFGYGGGMSNSGFTQIQGSFFTSNSAYTGGGIYNDGNGTVTETVGGSLFQFNAVTQDGGAIYNVGTLTLYGELFNGNAANTISDVISCGGAVCNQNLATITESTFANNSTNGSGGAVESYGNLTLGDDTISANTASAAGSGVDLGGSNVTTINNTIISGNTPIAGSSTPDCQNCANVSEIADLIGVTVDLGPLSYNGGATDTMMPLPGSPAIGTGGASIVPDDFDQRGFNRFSGNLVDIGAVQTHYSSVSFLTQPSTTVMGQTIAPAVQVQVIEVDGSTTNYPQGVPVNVSLLTSLGNPVAGLSGSLTQLPVLTAGVTAAPFADLSVSAAGSYELLASTVPTTSSASSNPAYASISNIFQITTPAVVTLGWQPAALTYGVPMPQSELNAVATINNVPATGTFVYTFTATSATINVGQVYPAAIYGVQVAFTPTGSTNTYTLGTAMAINQAAPVVHWATPAPIFTSTPLGAAQLDATATGVNNVALPGTFVYKPVAGTTLTAGPQLLSTVFTPTDSVDYTAAGGQVTIQVNAVTALSVAIQESANPITFGQSETFTAAVTGTDGNPFSGGTASFTVDGTAIGSATVVNGTASVTDTSLTAATHQIGVTYTNTTTNQTLTNSTTLTVNKAAPVLTWATPAAIFTSTPLSSTQLDATVTGVGGTALAGAFVYNPAAGTTLTAGPQVLHTTFTPTDTVDYSTATGQVTIQVNAVTAASVAIQESANPITFGQSETFTAVVTGSDSKPLSGGTASFTVDGTSIGSAPDVNGTASVTDSSLTGGTHQIAVTYTNTATNQTLTASTTLTVNKAVPVLTWATPAAIFTSTPLSSTQLDATVTGVGGTALAGAFVYNPAAGTTLTAGPHVLSTTFTPTDTVDYSTATGQVTIQVNAPTAASVAIQESANPITFGQSETFTAVVTGSDSKPLSGGTASFTVDGTSIGSAPDVNGTASVTDTSLTGGTHQIAVTYTNTATNQTLTASTTLTVNKAVPVLTWATPAAIFTSTALSSTQLDATVTGVGGTALAGAFVYNPAAGTTLTAGPHVLSTTFTPTDTVDYSTATGQVTIQVNAPTAASVAIQESANPITFGQSETFTAVVTGSDSKPLSGGTASFTVDGTSIGSAPDVNGTASVTDSSLTGGTHQIAVTYTNTATNQTLTASTTLTVNKAAPVLTWATPAAIFTSTALSSTQLDATVTGVGGTALAGAFVYNPAAGTTLTAGPHVLSTTFTPTDTVDYSTATGQVTIQVNAPTAASVAIQESANPITFGQSETFTAVVTGSDSKPLSGGTASFTVDGTAIGSAPDVNGTASVTDTSLTGGTHQIAVTYTNTATNQTLTSTATLTVNKAAPVLTWATPAAIFTSTALSATQLDATAKGVTGTALPGAFVYNPAAGTTLTAGPQVLHTTFTPTDTVDYSTATGQVTIQVNAPTAASVAIQESANPITFGQSETFTAVVTGSDSKPLSGGTASFTVDGTSIGSAPDVNGTASVTDSSLTGGTHQIAVTYTNTATNQTLTASTTLTVNKAVPVLTWATPAAIFTSTALSSTQLDATVTGVGGTALAGAFVYNPAAGTTLTAGPHVLSTTFTPTDTVDYSTATGQVTIQVNAPTAASVAIQESANPITFGQSETFTAVVTGSDSKPLSGGTASFTVDGTAIGSAPDVNGTASVTDSSLTGGTHQIAVTYTNTATNQTLTSTATLTVNKAAPVLTWATPAAIFTSTALSATQLDATAKGVTGTALAGTFVYNPAAGTTLTAGPQVLHTTFTPTDTVDYSTATGQVTIQVNAPTAGSVTIQESANPITFGQSETFTAVVTGTDGKPLSGGTASFTSDGTSIGSATDVNGTASVTASSLKAGTHQIGVTYTNTVTNQTLTNSTTLTVNKAAPVLTWATPAAIFTSTALGSSQLNATAKGVTGASLPGAFVYSPAAGTTLTAGPHVLSTTFTPTDTVDYSTATAQVTVQVNAPTAGSVTIQESANTITYGQSVTLTAVVTGTDGKPLSGGTASFTSDGAAIGSATDVNGTASVTASSLKAGTHQIGVSYSNPSTEQTLTNSATLTVNKAVPVLVWATPAAIYTSTALGSSQLDATVTGVGGTALPGTFVYSPAAGTTLTPGPHVLSATFTPTDAVDYSTATKQVTLQVNFAPINLVSVSPSTTPLSTQPVAISLTGSGFTSTSVVELNGSALVTVVQSATVVTATIPAASLAKAGSLNLTVYDSASKLASNSVSFSVTAPAADATISISPTTASDEQPTVTVTLNSPYSFPLTGTLTLTFAPDGTNGVDDPAVQFSTGGRTFNFNVAAGSTTTPQVAFQTGTVAGTITVTLTLTAGGVDVTPAGLAPITVVIAPAAPVITSVSFTNSTDGLVTVVVNGFSNTREVMEADFVFTGSGAGSLGTSTVKIPATGLFSPWYGAAASDVYGSAFSYTQNFQLSKPDSGITGVTVTLSNSIGISSSVNSK